MSALDPELWEATDKEVRKIAFIDETVGDATEEFNKVVESVARRRALAELRALHLFMRDNGFAAEYILRDRIAAIEAEEPTPPSASE